MDWRTRWDVWTIAAVLAARLLINMEMRALSLFFVACYGFFLFMLVKRVRLFSTVFVLFLTLDSMLATHVAAGSFGWVFYGTVAVNLVAITLVIQNMHGEFKA